MEITKQAIVRKFGIAIRLVEFSEKDAKESDIEEYMKKYPYWEGKGILSRYANKIKRGNV